MNKIVLVGRLTKDPELKTMPSGSSVLNFSVAVSRNFKNKEGQYDADFFNCVAFSNTADFISKFFKKGGMIGLDGRLQNRSYTAQDGSNRTVTEIMVNTAEFVGGKNEGSSNARVDNGFYQDAPAVESTDVHNESTGVDISNSDPYENYDGGVELSDDNLPF